MSNVKEIIESGKAYLGIEFGSTRIKAVLIDEEHNPIASGSHGRTVMRTDCGHTLWTISGQVFRTATAIWQKMYRKNTE